MPARPPAVGWIQQLGGRVLTYWPAKLVATTAGMTLFFVAYFWLLRHPQFPVTIMPLTAVDRMIGFWPEFLPLYLSLWVYVSLAPALLSDRRELLSYGVAAAALSIAGLGIFLLWPSAVPRPEVDWSQHASFLFLKSVDASGNACPSLHVAFAVFSAIWFERILRGVSAPPWGRAINWLWCAGILFSTIAVRQHVALDVLGGALLGAAAVFAHFRWLRPAVAHRQPPS